MKLENELPQNEQDRLNKLYPTVGLLRWPADDPLTLDSSKEGIERRNALQKAFRNFPSDVSSVNRKPQKRGASARDLFIAGAKACQSLSDRAGRWLSSEESKELEAIGRKSMGAAQEGINEANDLLDQARFGRK